MTHRLARVLAFTVFAGVFLFATSTYSYGQDSARPRSAKRVTAKSKKVAQSRKSEESNKVAQPGEAAKAEATGANKPQPAKSDEAKKEEAPPPPPSPKLIEVPQDDTTYTPHPKVVAVFVFTNGSRIESDDYLITKDALFINKDGQKTRYPINSVDRAATKAANEGRGVDIVFPKSRSEFNLDF